jgi:hypothetical protein
VSDMNYSAWAEGRHFVNGADLAVPEIQCC